MLRKKNSNFGKRAPMGEGFAKDGPVGESFDKRASIGQEEVDEIGEI